MRSISGPGSSTDSQIGSTRHCWAPATPPSFGTWSHHPPPLYPGGAMASRTAATPSSATSPSARQQDSLSLSIYYAPVSVLSALYALTHHFTNIHQHIRSQMLDKGLAPAVMTAVPHPVALESGVWWARQPWECPWWGGEDVLIDRGREHTTRTLPGPSPLHLQHLFSIHLKELAILDASSSFPHPSSRGSDLLVPHCCPATALFRSR